MKVIENIESVLPLYKLTKTGVILIPNVEIPKISGGLEMELASEEIGRGAEEGDTKEIINELEHRDPELRKQAIEKNKGYYCWICGFNFEDIYGDVGKYIIEVHHKKKLSEGVRITKVDDLVVVCANCHRVLHHNKDEMMDVGELKKIVEERRKLKKITIIS